jgi:hypothetical protein
MKRCTNGFEILRGIFFFQRAWTRNEVAKKNFAYWMSKGGFNEGSNFGS